MTSLMGYIWRGYTVIGGLLLAAVGTGIALTKGWPWLAFLLLLPLTLALLAAAFHWKNEHRKIDSALKAKTQRCQSLEDDLERQSAVLLADLKRTIQENGLANASLVVLKSMQLLDRMKQFATAHDAESIDIRQIIKDGQRLYVAASLAEPAVELLRVGDAFLLMRAAAGGARSKVGMVRLNQRPKNGNIFLIVEVVFNEEVTDALMALADAGNPAEIKGFSIELPFDVAPFQGEELQMATAALRQMLDTLNMPYLEEVTHA